MVGIKPRIGERPRASKNITQPLIVAYGVHAIIQTNNSTPTLLDSVRSILIWNINKIFLEAHFKIDNIAKAYFNITVLY